jgi:hypothetical protein
VQHTHRSERKHSRISEQGGAIFKIRHGDTDKV